MAVLQGTRFLDSVRFKAIVETLASELERIRPLTFIDRLPLVPAWDDEIIGRFTGKVFAADIIADDQEAVVHEAGKVELVTNAIPNLKHGQFLSQSKINAILRLRDFGGRAEEEDALEQWEGEIAERLVFGVRQRMNALACAMMLDAFSYNRLGIQISGATWGMPSEFKVTVSPTWAAANAATATPIANINSLRNVIQQNYGLMFNRLTMSSTAFDLMTGTTEFANKASIQLGAGFLVTPAAMATNDRDQMKNIVGKMLNMTIEIDDGTYNEKTNEGKMVQRRYLPENKIIFDATENDNNRQVWDMANGVVTESVVESAMGGSSAVFSGGERGPIGYLTGPPDLNPPNVTAWGVARCFPRKHVPECSAVLTVY